MAKRSEKNEEDVKAWLLGFEKQAGAPVVVSLLIEDGDAHFLSSIAKNKFTDEALEADDDTPAVRLEEVKKRAYYHALMERDYIR